jgi:hypothetical protein
LSSKANYYCRKWIRQSRYVRMREDYSCSISNDISERTFSWDSRSLKRMS